MATKGEDAEVDLFLHPAIIVPPALNVTLDATLTSALRVEAVRYTAVVTPPDNASELKVEAVVVLS